jgi:hypothetical protein
VCHGAIALAKDPKPHPRTKHIAIQHHWLREKIAEQVINLEYVQTSKQVATVLQNLCQTLLKRFGKR